MYKGVEKAPGDDTAVALLDDRLYVAHVRFSAARDQEHTELSLNPLGIELA